MKSQGRLIIIAAPSGTGKTSVISRILLAHPEIMYSVSYTTRPMRQGDKDGKDYWFIDRKKFEEDIKKNMFAEWAKVHDQLYGTPKEPLEKWLAMKKDVIFDVDVVGSMNLKKMYGANAISIFLLPPSMEELKRRLFSRGTDSEEQKQIRLKNALKEMTYKDKFDHQVVNDVLDRACSEVEKIIG